jgi:hypothetical protein
MSPSLPKISVVIALVSRYAVTTQEMSAGSCIAAPMLLSAVATIVWSRFAMNNTSISGTINTSRPRARPSVAFCPAPFPTAISTDMTDLHRSVRVTCVIK